MIKQREVIVNNERLAKDIKKFGKGPNRILHSLKQKGQLCQRPSTAKILKDKKSHTNLKIEE